MFATTYRRTEEEEREYKRRRAEAARRRRQNLSEEQKAAERERNAAACTPKAAAPNGRAASGGTLNGTVRVERTHKYGPPNGNAMPRRGEGVERTRTCGPPSAHAAGNVDWRRALDHRLGGSVGLKLAGIGGRHRRGRPRRRCGREVRVAKTTQAAARRLGSVVQRVRPPMLPPRRLRGVAATRPNAGSRVSRRRARRGLRAVPGVQGLPGSRECRPGGATLRIRVPANAGVVDDYQFGQSGEFSNKVCRALDTPTILGHVTFSGCQQDEEEQPVSCDVHGPMPVLTTRSTQTDAVMPPSKRVDIAIGSLWIDDRGVSRSTQTQTSSFIAAKVHSWTATEMNGLPKRRSLLRKKTSFPSPERSARDAGVMTYAETVTENGGEMNEKDDAQHETVEGRVMTGGGWIRCGIVFIGSRGKVSLVS
ncbi:hypothetical protein HPB51_000340 [Rhipicephalus microplus]|uniref:Uncharacterized protein n=1 Tax=Rhipicephalus microplus TaxID=6941 RepID=A0A9J6E4Y4_RHIMP|nr:hypothetical protein HPB51_000340 [Rhipicephalus microplus]